MRWEQEFVLGVHGAPFRLERQILKWPNSRYGVLKGGRVLKYYHLTYRTLWSNCGSNTAEPPLRRASSLEETS
jgi:hypothetical protein